MGEELPIDNLMMQTGSDHKFIGNLFWDLADVITFGALEKEPHPKEVINPH